MGLNLSREEYLLSDAPLEMRIGELFRSGFPPDDFVRVGLMMIERASPEEKERCTEQISELRRLIKGRQARLKLAS